MKPLQADQQLRSVSLAYSVALQASKPKSSPRRRRALDASTDRRLTERSGEVFFLDILSHRMSAMTPWSKSTARIGAMSRQGWFMLPTKPAPSNASPHPSPGSSRSCLGCEVAILSPAEFAFRWRGLEFARARITAEAVTLQSKQDIVFGVGAEERVLEDRNWTFFVQLLTDIARCPTSLRRASPSSVSHASRALAGVSGENGCQRD